MATISKIVDKEAANSCGGFQEPKGHLDTQMFPECAGTETDRNALKTPYEERKKKKKSKNKKSCPSGSCSAKNQEFMEKKAKHGEVITQEWNEWQSHKNDPIAAANFLDRIAFAQAMGYSDISQDKSTRRGLDDVITRWNKIKKFRDLGPVQEEMYDLASKASAFLSMSANVDENIYAYNRKKKLEAKEKKEKKEWDPNPWAVCHTTVDKEKDPEKYERCVKEVKKQQASTIPDQVVKTAQILEDGGGSTPEPPKEFVNITVPRGSPDVDLFMGVVNQGIDSYLEGFTESNFNWDESGDQVRLVMNFHNSELPVLVRRLNEVGTDEALLWARDIEELPEYVAVSNAKANEVLSSSLDKLMKTSQEYRPGINSVRVIYPGDKEFDVPVIPEVSAEGPEEILEYVFAQLQHHDGPETWIDSQSQMRSSMVGDIYMLNGTNWVVLGTGFAEISPEQATKWAKIPDKDRLMALSFESFNEILNKTENTTENTTEASLRNSWEKIGQKNGWIETIETIEATVDEVGDPRRYREMEESRDMRRDHAKEVFHSVIDQAIQSSTTTPNSEDAFRSVKAKAQLIDKIEDLMLEKGVSENDINNTIEFYLDDYLGI